MPKDRLPILDMSRDPEDVARALNAACEQVGFFYLTNHGVPEELLRPPFVVNASAAGTIVPTG